MSEKQFTYGETDLFEWVEDNGKMISTKECVKKLNEQQSDLNYLARFIGEFKVDEFKEKLRTLRTLEDKVDNQQAIIQKQERIIEILENLLTNMGVKWVGDDD